MRMIGSFLLLALVSASLPQPGRAQAATAPPAQIVTLGNSATVLTGPWKFSPGDSPWVNGVPGWAQPEFDDSQWAEMDFTPEAGSFDRQFGTSGYVPGWTRRGYPNLSGYAWYRLRLPVRDAGQPLWLKMPNDFDDAYQVYANGRYVGQFGHFSLNRVKMYHSEPVSFPLPPPGPGGRIDLAVRFYLIAATPFMAPDVGGMHQPPVLGLSSTVHLLEAAENEAHLRFHVGTMIEALLFFLIAPLALWAWLENRRERTYLWLSLALACFALDGFLTILGNLTLVLPFAFSTIFVAIILDTLWLPMWVMVWWHWFGLRQKRWIPLAAWLLTAARMLVLFCEQSSYVGLGEAPLTWLHRFNFASIWCLPATGLLLVVILAEGFRRDRTEALLATVPILLIEFASFGDFLLVTFDIRNTFLPFGIGISVNNIASILSVLVIGGLAMRRFLRTQVRQELDRQAIAQDLKQARELQQHVLISESEHSKAFRVETEYRPAQTVGGDFFQTLVRPDGRLLVVIGDVSGKGVSAAMLVAVLVGAIRNQAEYSFDPASMLTMLNRHLLGRSGGHFATCLVAEILPDGKTRIANAGHLPPYLNGEAMNLEGSLPLGLSGEAASPTQTLTLQPGDCLTFLTDGVVEAAKPGGELFGFERAQAISGQSAASIAQQAQVFGQNDDITVLRVEFTGATQAAMA